MRLSSIFMGKKGKEVIVITDNGHGMTCDDLARKFLTVGYERRASGNDGDETPKYKRQPMGRKGIGKLSLFSIAQNIEVHTKKGKEKTAILMDRKKLENGVGEYVLPVLPDEKFKNFPYKSGTLIIISNLDKKRIPAAVDHLRKRLARRFTLPCMETMKIIMNGTPIIAADRDYFEKLAHLFQYESKYDKYCPHLSDSAVNTRPYRFNAEGKADENGQFSVRGWSGFAKPLKSGASPKRTETPAKQGENQIFVMVREKQAKADILKSFGISSFFGPYVFGEINADFLDETDKEDIATSSRQDIREDDPRYIALCKFMRQEVWKLQPHWDALRDKAGVNKARELLPHFDEILDDMRDDERKKFEALFGKINHFADKDDRQLFACGLYVFERFRRKNALDALKHISIDNVDEFVKIAVRLGELEAAEYYAIAKNRLNIIRKLSNMVDNNVLEKYLRDLLYENLWLLSPSWDRATAPDARMEEQVTKAFKKVDEKINRNRKERD